MRSEGPKRFEIGDSIDATTVKGLGGRRFEMRSRDVPAGWHLILTASNPDTIEMRRSTTYWVAKVTPVRKTIMIRDGDHGRLPISTAMAARYRTALKMLKGEVEPTGEGLADAKGMFARIETQDSADWLTVHRLLGAQPRGDRAEIIQEIDRLRDQRKSSPEEFTSGLVAFAEKHAEWLNAALHELT